MPETRPRRSGEILKTHRHKRRDHGSHRRIDMGTTARAGSRPALELAEKRLPSKRQLEIMLSKLKILETPTLRLEQYPVSAEAAAELLYMAGFEHDDLEGRIIDLGTGTGRLAIGASLTYSSHKDSTRPFLDRYVNKWRRRIAETRSMSMKIPHFFSFHARRWKSIEVDLCRIVT